MCKNVISYQYVNGKRHHDDGDQQIGQRQRHDKVVGDRLQGALSVHGKNDQHVAEQRENGEQQQNERPVAEVGWEHLRIILMLKS